MDIYSLSESLLGILPQESTYLYSILTLILCIAIIFVILSPFIILLKLGGK